MISARTTGSAALTARANASFNEYEKKLMQSGSWMHFSLAGVLLLSACGSSGASDLHEAEGYYFDTDVELKLMIKTGRHF